MKKETTSPAASYPWFKGLLGALHLIAAIIGANAAGSLFRDENKDSRAIGIIMTVFSVLNAALGILRIVEFLTPLFTPTNDSPDDPCDFCCDSCDRFEDCVQLERRD